ncbi:MAG TPA: protein kinase, partial [Kofleriaceae bacterium]|nr:protein kinase [Kofleriaceae bacterium]
MFVRAEHLRSQLLQSVRAGDEPLLPGTRFELLKVLRQDRHGVVYRAYDTDEDCLSDLRLVETRYPEDASQNLRAVAARLQRVVGEGFARFDVESSDAGPCLVSSASDAPTLRTWLGDPRARTWSFVSTLAIYVATSLAELHRHGAVHGDVRPDAILFARNENDAEISLVDVALSAVLDGVVPEYARELPPGDAYAYAPPERMAGLRDDAQADQYAFCATLWELVYGCPPWADVQPYTREWMLARLECPPRAEPVSWVPAGFDAVLRRGLSPGPRDRYRDMIALRDALEALQYVTPEEAHAAHAALDRVASECMERLARLAPLDRATLIDKAVHDLLSLGYDELDAFERIDAD